MGRWARLVLPRTYMDRQRRAGFLFVLPAVAYFTAVYFVPLVESLVGLRPQQWLQSLDGVLPSLALVTVWVRLGFDTMIFLAALQAIPREYHEAAKIDGATARQRLRHVTLPLLNPHILMVCILELIFNFKIFDQVYATTQGGPAGASQTIIPLLYDTAFKYFRLGEASVMAVFVFAVLLAVTLVQWRIFRKPVEY